MWKTPTRANKGYSTATKTWKLKLNKKLRRFGRERIKQNQYLYGLIVILVGHLIIAKLKSLTDDEFQGHDVRLSFYGIQDIIRKRKLMG